MLPLAALAAALLAGAIGLRFHFERARRLEEAGRIARELIPEIQAVMASCDSAGASREPLAGGRFALLRQRLPAILSRESLFAVETFYQCAEAYARASEEMTAAFSSGSELGLGDRIRAKDRRDRCLKDVYYTGEAALERLRK